MRNLEPLDVEHEPDDDWTPLDATAQAELSAIMQEHFEYEHHDDGVHKVVTVPKAVANIDQAAGAYTPTASGTESVFFVGVTDNGVGDLSIEVDHAMRSIRDYILLGQTDWIDAARFVYEQDLSGKSTTVANIMIRDNANVVQDEGLIILALGMRSAP